METDILYRGTTGFSEAAPSQSPQPPPGIRQLSSLSLLQGHLWNCVGPAHHHLVQSLSFQDLHFSVGHGRTTASCCLPLCLILWTVCPSDSFLKTTDVAFQDSTCLLFIFFCKCISTQIQWDNFCFIAVERILSRETKQHSRIVL